MTAFMNETLKQDKSEADILCLLAEVAGVGSPDVVRDAKGAPLLSFPSFLAFIERQISSPPSEALAPVFAYLDSDKDGRVTAADLNAFSSNVGLRLGEDGASQLLRSAGGTSDSVDFELFCSVVSKCLPS
ncbi:calmodulin CAM1 [Cyclospora cayetanensis]|uniref:Calmodulin CAM1 n=1 Tax=Cyclospora cayetanensis TaxID=88456 RepID=A0A1D3D472_9EIME|nr:calmodulin CAM1 [Cyclospora cayetanensis]